MSHPYQHPSATYYAQAGQATNYVQPDQANQANQGNWVNQANSANSAQAGQYAQASAYTQTGQPTNVVPQYVHQPSAAYAPSQSSLTNGWFAFSDPGYIKGFLLGAGIAYVLSNQKVQRAVVKGAVSAVTAIQGGFEEMKEQIQDIKSEMSMKHDESDNA